MSIKIKAEIDEKGRLRLLEELPAGLGRRQVVIEILDAPDAKAQEVAAAELAFTATVNRLESVIPEKLVDEKSLIKPLAPDEPMVLNGINPVTGRSLFEPFTEFELFEAIVAEKQAEWQALEARRKALLEVYLKKNRKDLDVIAGYDPENWKSSRWGVVYAPDTPAEVRQALAKLIRYRKGNDSLPVEFTYQPGKGAYEFRKDFGQDYGLVDPKKLPYYLLIVGSPEEVPFDFQYDLQTEHAVGRLWFPQAAQYETYAQRVLKYETASQLARRNKMGVFSTRHDKTTLQSAELLAKRMAQVFASGKLEAKSEVLADDMLSFSPQVIHQDGAAATTQTLLDMLAGDASLVFTATHGLEFDYQAPAQRSRQRSEQGAILTGDWDGAQSPVQEAWYLSGDKIPTAGDYSGLMVMAFACYGAGTPREDPYAQFFPKGRPQVADAPFLADLPLRLLAQGALAWIGHVERAWSYSYGWPGYGAFTGTFEESLRGLLCGKPVGHVMEKNFGRRYLALNNDLTNDRSGLLASSDLQMTENLRRLWLARNDARGYIVLGDPAVHLRPLKMNEGA